MAEVTSYTLWAEHYGFKPTTKAKRPPFIHFNKYAAHSLQIQVLTWGLRIILTNTDLNMRCLDSRFFVYEKCVALPEVNKTFTLTKGQDFKWHQWLNFAET
jgi:hypothetical protein